MSSTAPVQVATEEYIDSDKLEPRKCDVTLPVNALTGHTFFNDMVNSFNNISVQGMSMGAKRRKKIGKKDILYRRVCLLKNRKKQSLLGLLV
jgi:hypothetical protein